MEHRIRMRESNMVLSKVEKPAIEAVLAEASAAKLKELAKNYYVCLLYTSDAADE